MAGHRRQLALWSTLAVILLSTVPTAAAHTDTAGGLEQWHGIAIALLGFFVLAGGVLGKRSGQLSPKTALGVVFAGLAVAILGIVLYDGLAPEPTYSAATMPFPRRWYPAIALGGGFALLVGSFVVGLLRWPDRPRYTVLGFLAAFWISYPALIPGSRGTDHPLGYLLVLGTPVVVGYVVWRDAGQLVRAAMADRIAGLFGIGVALLVALFFLTASGFVSFFWETGVPRERAVVVLPVIYQLVVWPTLEVALPSIPVFIAISIGIAVTVGTLSALVGLNAAVIARQWRAGTAAGATESAAGSAAIVGTCTCGCCGPLVAKVAVLAAGPSIAAPIYWVFVDSASPLSSAFVIGSLLLFTGSLVYSVEQRPIGDVATA